MIVTPLGEEPVDVTLVAFDLETAPEPKALTEPPPEFKAGWRLRDPAEKAADIEAQRADWEANKIKYCSLDHHRARIVAAGVVGDIVEDGPIEEAWVARDEAEERKLIRDLWDVIGRVFKDRDHRGTILTFNGHSFDIPLLYWRSARLRVWPTVQRFQLGYRYSYGRPHFDVREVLGNFETYAKGTLHEYCRWLGIQSPKDKMDGSAVYKAVCDERWDDLKEYALTDARAVYKIFERTAGYYWNSKSEPRSY